MKYVRDGYNNYRAGQKSYKYTETQPKSVSISIVSGFGNIAGANLFFEKVVIPTRPA